MNEETTKLGRREAIKGGLAVAGGVVAAGYVKPSLRALGVPAAVAGSKGSIDVDTLGCSIIWNAAGTVPTSVYGQFTLENVSDACCLIEVTRVEVYLQDDSLSLGGCGKDLTVGLLNTVYDTTEDPSVMDPVVTGLPNPLTVGMVFGCETTAIPQPKSGTFGFAIAIPAAYASVTKFRVVLLVDIEPSPQHDKVWTECASVSV